MLVVIAVLAASCTTIDGTDDRGRDAAKVNTQLGIAYLEQGQVERSLERLKTALEFDRNSVDAHLTIAHVYTTIGQTADAERHYERASSLAPERANVLNNYGTFLCSQKRYQEAVEKFSQAANSPFYDTPQAALANAGVCAYQAGMNETAEQFLRQALEQDPKYASALITLAELYAGREEFFKARAFMQRYQSVGRITPNFLMLGYRIEDALNNSNDRDAFREQLINDFPDSNEARRLMRGDD